VAPNDCSARRVDTDVSEIRSRHRSAFGHGRPQGQRFLLPRRTSRAKCSLTSCAPLGRVSESAALTGHARRERAATRTRTFTPDASSIRRIDAITFHERQHREELRRRFYLRGTGRGPVARRSSRSIGRSRRSRAPARIETRRSCGALQNNTNSPISATTGSSIFRRRAVGALARAVSLITLWIFATVHCRLRATRSHSNRWFARHDSAPTICLSSRSFGTGVEGQRAKVGSMPGVSQVGGRESQGGRRREGGRRVRVVLLFGLPVSRRPAGPPPRIPRAVQSACGR